MYGGHVHQAVKDAGEQMSGMTIHYVNEAYDEGAIILQARVPILPEDSAEDIGAKVLKLEHFYYPLVVEELVKQLPE
jgi:phosphoribosylglycinamide formyltransferase-1